MAGVRTTLTEAQIEARRNHYLEKVGRGKPKAKGTKNNPLKNKDLSKMLKERFNKKQNNHQACAGTNTNEAIAELNKQQQNRPLTNAEAHQIQNNVSDKSLEALKKAKANLEAEELASAQAQTNADAAAARKNSPEPKTWKKYLNERGVDYNEPKSRIGEAEKKAAEVIKKNNVFRKEALTNAEQINKPFVTSAGKIDRQLGIGKTSYPVSSNYADDYAKLMDEKYGKIGGSGIDPIPPKPEKSKVKTGFFSKIGKFFKSKKGKLALAGLLVTVVGAGIAYFASKNKSKQTNDTNAIAPDTIAASTSPEAPEQQAEQQKVNKYCIDIEEGKMPKSYTFKKGDYPSAIIAEAYGVKYGTPEYNAIRDAVYEASEYEKNTNLKVGDKFTLPDVKVGGKTYSANEKAEAASGLVIDNGLKTSRTKEVVKEGDKFYIVFCETGERVPDELSFDSMEKAQQRILDLENADE